MDLPEQIGDLLARLRAVRPLIHHITNLVTMHDVADATLALGALPVMALAGEEVEEIVATAQALVLNLGTPTRERIEVMIRAGKAANARGIPVVLDPVGVGASAFRTANTRRLLAELRIDVVRANAGEAAALLGVGGTVRGVESEGAALPPDVLARRLARATGVVAAVTGARDHASDGARTAAVDNGDPMLPRISGGGDLATAIVAAFATVANDPLLAAVGGLAALGCAAEMAAPHAQGPGSFKAALVDALAGLTPANLRGRARVQVLGKVWT